MRSAPALMFISCVIIQHAFKMCILLEDQIKKCKRQICLVKDLKIFASHLQMTSLFKLVFKYYRNKLMTPTLMTPTLNSLRFVATELQVPIIGGR